MRLRSYCSPSREEMDIKSSTLNIANMINPPLQYNVPLGKDLLPKRKNIPKRRQAAHRTDLLNFTEYQQRLKEPSSFITPKNKMISKPPISSYRKSTTAGWRRIFAKYSPSTEIAFSPLKATQVNLDQVVLGIVDPHIDISTWVVNMSEQFFYDNTFLLLNSSKSDPILTKKRIRHNYKGVDFRFFNNLKNITLLGEGGFGKVFSCEDITTKKLYAVKYISVDAKDSTEHCESLLSYMAERNYIIRAMNSPFVMNFYYSLNLKSAGGLFLFFEYCIGDLSTYISRIAVNDFFAISKQLDRNEMEIIQDLDKDIGVIDVSLMYIFEMFCGLDFLVQANIIHQDIKPENLMVSETMHLKIGDFGLVYRTRTIHRNSNKLLVKHDDIDVIESSNYDLFIYGTYDYQDLETKLMELEDEEHPVFNQIIAGSKQFNTFKLRYDDEILTPTFLTDLWAAGIVCINLLFRGFHIFNPDMASMDILPDVPKKNLNEFLVHLVGKRRLYNKYVYKGLLNSGGVGHRELMEFIASIFLPKETRSKLYTKQKVIYRYSKKVKLSYIDLVKIEKIKSFKVRKFNSKNVFTLTVPERIRNLFHTKREPNFDTFVDLVRSIRKVGKEDSLIDLKPGMSINYFH